jgi:DNA-binding NtrC family response regulator
LGIGLWWCKTFVEATGGQLVLATAQPTVGCSMVARIKTGEPDTASARRRPAIDPSVLIVEDDEGYATELKEFVADICDVQLATSAKVAREKLTRERYSLVVLDVSLEAAGIDKKGLDLLDLLQNDETNTKVVIATSDKDRLAGERLDPQLVIDVLDKSNLSRAKLRAVVESVLSEGGGQPQ